jgi:phage shock protein E
MPNNYARSAGVVVFTRPKKSRSPTGKIAMLRRLNYLLITGLLLIMSNLAQANAIWIDVRTADEFNAGHIEGAAHIPYDEIAVRIGEVTSDKNAVIHLYCRSGNRSGIAQQILQSIGFNNAVNEGGYEALLQQQASQ